MARIQMLTLPTQTPDGQYEFAIIIDQVTADEANSGALDPDALREFRRQVGAKGGLCTPATLEVL